MGPVTEQVVKGNDPHRGQRQVCEGDRARVGVGHGISGQNYCVIGINCPAYFSTGVQNSGSFRTQEYMPNTLI